jgi:NAD(P)-dependent dehydrogenase (short-subunit alcohol dehydrogenase family)
MAPSPFAVVAGVGPGTGAAVARRFGKAYPIALLARSPENFESLVKEINGSGGKAIGISTDVSSEESVKKAFEKIKQEFEGAGCAAAIFNASGPFSRKPLLEMKVEEFSKSWEVSA